MVADGLDVHADPSTSTPMVHRLAHRSEDDFLAWAQVLHPYGVPWETVWGGHTVIQELVRRHRPRAVDLLMEWGVPLPTTPPPVQLCLQGRHDLMGMLRNLAAYGLMAHCQAEYFYPAAIEAGLPLMCLPECEAWGLPLSTTPETLLAALASNRPKVDWIAHLIAQGANPDAVSLVQGVSARAHAIEQGNHIGKGRRTFVARFEEAVREGLRRYFHTTLRQPETGGGPRQRL